MGINPIYPIGVVIALRLIIAVMNNAATEANTGAPPCGNDSLDENGQCEAPSLLSLFSGYVLGQIDDAPAGINLVVGVISFLFIALSVFALYQAIRGI